MRGEVAKKDRPTRPTRPAKAPRKEPANEELRLEYIPLEELKRAPKNPKLHDHDAIGASIERFGYVLPVTIDEATGQLVAGHGRLEVLSKMKAEGKDPPARIRVGADGSWSVPTLRGVRFKDAKEAEAYLLADNRLVEIGGWDLEPLMEVLSSFGDEDLSSLGFSAEDIEKMSNELEARKIPVQPPTEFVSFTASSVKTDHECPKCKFRWSE